MIKVGILGDIGSGKSFVAKQFNCPVFNADIEVAKIYNKNRTCFKRLKKQLPKYISSFPIKKNEIGKAILNGERNLKKIVKIVHPIVRNKMNKFFIENKNKKIVILDIPLLVENKLTKYFDSVIFIKSRNNLRLRRYKLKGGSVKLFALLNKQQLPDVKKMKFCDHIVVNNKSLSILKRKLSNIIKLYE